MTAAARIVFRASGTNGRGGVYAYLGKAIISLDSWYESAYGVPALEMAWGPAPARHLYNLAVAMLVCAGVPTQEATETAQMFAQVFLRKAPDEWEVTAEQLLGWCAALPLYVKLAEWSQGRERWQDPSRN